MQSTPGTALGTVSVVNSNTQVTLTGNAASTTGGVGFGRQVVPGVNDGINKAVNDIVNIGNASAGLGSTTVTYDMTGDTILQLSGSLPPTEWLSPWAMPRTDWLAARRPPFTPSKSLPTPGATLGSPEINSSKR